MTENEQIEEMARDIDSGDDCIEPCKECAYYRYPNCRDVKIAKRLYSKGYRKVERGEWKTVAEHKISIITECSACKVQFYFMKKGQLNIDRMPHCPNCGADMRGGKDA